VRIQTIKCSTKDYKKKLTVGDVDPLDGLPVIDIQVLELVFSVRLPGNVAVVYCDESLSLVLTCNGLVVEAKVISEDGPSNKSTGIGGSVLNQGGGFVLSHCDVRVKVRVEANGRAIT
jgi:hypothetical protein